MEIFSCKYDTFSQPQSVHKPTAFQDAGWNLCSSIIFGTRHDCKKHNQSELGKEKSALLDSALLLDYFFLYGVFALRTGNFVLIVKPKTIYKLNKLKH